MEYHELADIFPLDEGQLFLLAEDIQENGLREKIETFEGRILDGRRRFLACKEAKVEPEFRAVRPKDPVDYVISKNMALRKLTQTPRAMAADKARCLYDKTIAKTKGKGVVLLVDARDHVHQKLEIGPKFVTMAAKVREGCLPEVYLETQSGRVSVVRAAAWIGESKEEQMRLLRASLRSNNKRLVATGLVRPRRKSRGIGVQRANEALNILRKIPEDDGLRVRGLEIVVDWITNNK